MSTTESRYEYVARWRLKNGAERSSDDRRDADRSLWGATYAAERVRQKGHEPRIERRVVTRSVGEWVEVDLEETMALPRFSQPVPPNHLVPASPERVVRDVRTSGPATTPEGPQAMRFDGTRDSITAICRWANTGDTEDPPISYLFRADSDVADVQVWTADGGPEALVAGEWVARRDDGELVVLRPASPEPKGGDPR